VTGKLCLRAIAPTVDAETSEHFRNAKIRSFPELLMESVRTGLRQIMQDLLRTRPVDEAVILAWPLVCGKEVAARTQAVTFTEGILTVEVSDVSWRNQLQSFATRYLAGYESYLGPVVTGVRFRVKPVEGAERQSGPEKARP
jgi:hypothetical protein